MKHFKLFFACALMSLLSLGQLWATEVEAYTLTVASTGGNSSPHNSYTAAATTTIDGIEWSVLGNSNQSPWRLGGKESNCSGADRDVHSNTAITDNISKIEITHGTASNITVNSMTVIVSTNSDFSDPVSTLTPDFVAEDVVTVNRPAGKDWSNCYYKIVYNLSVTGNSNRFVQFSGATFYKESGGTPTCATPTFSVAAGAVVSGTEVTISSATEGATVYYTTDGSDPTTGSATTQPIVISANTTIKAIAVKDGMDNSSVASAAYTVVTPYTTIADLFNDKTGSDVPVYVTFGGWQVSVAKGNQAFVTDGTNGLIIYQSGHGLTEGDILTGTVACTLVAYNGVAELKGITKTMDGITVTGGTISPVVKTIEQANALTEINTGLLVKLEDVTYNGSAFVDAGSNTIAPYNTFYLYSLTSGQKYNVTGIVQQYSSNTQIYPRKAADIEALTTIATPTFSPAAGTYTVVQSVEIECATAGATIYYTTNGDTPDNTSTEYTGAITVDATKTIKAIAYKGDDHSEVATAAYTINLPLPSHDFQVTHMFTEASGFDFSEWSTSYAVRQATYTDDRVDFAGASKQGSGQAIDDRPVTKNQAISLVLTNVAKVITAVRFDYAQWGAKTQTLTMQYSTDHGASYNNFDPVVSSTDFVLQVLTLPAGVNAIQVTGSSSSNQVGLTSIAFDLDDAPVVHGSITYVENGANEDIADVADAISLPDPLPTVTKGGNSFGGWFTDPEFNTPAVAGAALTGDVTLYAKWVVIPYWATVYSSNVSVAHTGSGNDNCTITIGTDEPYALVKAGAGSSAGTIVVTVPASTHTLHFHAFAWGGKTSKIEISGVDNPTVTEFDIAGESGASGSSNDFTLAGNPVDQYFYVSFDAVAAETEIVFSEATGSADHRFFFYGVNQEGGVLPVLESIEISGDLDNKTGYKVGDALDLTGLTVMATYSLAGTPQAPVDITSDPGLTLTYDPLVENQTEVTITATFGGQTDDITITGLEAVASATPEIITDVNSRSWTVTKDAAIPAGKTFTVTLNSVAAATAALGGTNPEAFDIDKTALVDGDVITVSVVSTATVGSYTATITISDNAGVAADKVVTVNLTVNEPEVPETPVSTTSKWVEATAISNGMEVIIVGVNGDDAYAMGEQGGNNRAAVAGTLDAGVFTPGDNTMSFTLVDQGDGTYAIRTSGGKYLYAASSTKNYLRSQATVDENAKWTLTVASAEAESSSNNHVMQFNSGSSIFSCYATASQKAIAFYVPQSSTPTADYTRDDSWITSGELGTVCISHGVASVNGANIYQLAGKQAGNVVFESVTTMEPGLPYLFEATANQVEFFFSAEAEAGSAGSHKGMYGTFSDITITTDLDNTYYFAGHTLWSSSDLTSTGLSVPANRAYIKMDEVPTMGANPAPGKRYITLSVHGANATTGMDELNATDAPRKMILDGQLFILRGEKMYNANGQLVK